MSAIEARQRGESPTSVAAKKSRRGSSSSAASSSVSGLTIESLAKERGLTVEFLTQLGLRNLPFKSGVEIPYKDESGVVVLYKERHAGAVKFRWPFGAPLMAYGVWLLKLARNAKRLVLVEGESDSWTLWYHAVPALGIPGAAAVARTLQAPHLAGIDDLLIVEEADTGGATFKREVCARLRTINYKGRVSVFEMAPTGSKDISDLYRADRKSFGKGLKSWGK
jgi:putative DNA primase/helicase